jgi:16S rRNA (uracil1498-N3)-methyltransferase
MTRRRWIADEVSGNRAVLAGAHAEHLANVLRARVGQEFDIVTGTGVRRGTISNIRHGKIDFELGDKIPAVTAPNLMVLLSIFKFDRMEWAIEKCTELGVSQIVPVISQRTESHLATAATKRVERWQRIVRQASEQSRRDSAPSVSLPLKLRDALALVANRRIVLAETEHGTLLKDVLDSEPEGREVALAFGPEGGWTDAELEQFRAAGWTAASLGNTILRAETAAIAAVAVAMSQLQG